MILTSILGTVLGTLINAGCDVASDFMKGATEKGVEKVQTFIEEKTGIPMVDSSGDVREFSSEEMETLTKCINENQIKLKELALESQRLANEDRADARDMQNSVTRAVVDAARTGNQTAVEGLLANSKRVYHLGILLILLNYLIKFVVMLVPEAYINTNLAAQMIPSTDNILMIIVGFFFGTSFSGSSKDSSEVNTSSKTPKDWKKRFTDLVKK
jgi:hypothetical protein